MNEAKWIRAEDKLPPDYSAVNVVYVNRDPPNYYAHEKDIPHTGTAHYFSPTGSWYWYSAICEDMLAEYGDSITDRVAEGIEITHWMPLPEPDCDDSGTVGMDIVPWAFLERYADWFCAIVPYPEFVREAKMFYLDSIRAMEGGIISDE